jgi:hypothetical protein
MGQDYDEIDCYTIFWIYDLLNGMLVLVHLEQITQCKKL